MRSTEFCEESEEWLQLYQTKFKELVSLSFGLCILAVKVFGESLDLSGKRTSHDSRYLASSNYKDPAATQRPSNHAFYFLI